MRKILTLLLMSLLTCVNAQAVGEDFVKDGIRYVIFVSGDDVGDDGISACVEPINGSPYSGNITIPERVSYNGKSYVVSMIDQYAFADCENLRSVSLPNTITEIRDGAFEGCTSLTKIVIPNSVLRLWSRAFKDASSLSSVTIGNSVEEIPDEAFAGCTSLKSITFPKNIKKIYRDALEGCTGLEKVSFDCVVEIGELLRGNKSLREVVLAEGYKEIKGRTFEKCTALEYVKIPWSIETIGNKAFAGTALTSLSFPGGAETIYQEAFANCEKLKTIDFGRGVKSIADRAFEGCNSLERVDIADGCEMIYPRAFSNCQNLRVASIPKSVKYIGTNLFDGCPLDSLILDVPKIDRWFQNLLSVKCIRLAEHVEEIGSNAFWGCKNMEKCIIGGGVKSIGGDAFRLCEGLREITSLNHTPPQMPETFSSFDASAYETATLMVPEESVDLYKNAKEWKKFYKIKGISGIAPSEPVHPDNPPTPTPATEGSAIKLEFGGTSMTIELSQQPMIVMEDGYLVLKTSTMSVALSLPCTATFVGTSHTAIDKVLMHNNDEEKPLNVFTLGGRKVATLKDKNELITLKRGIYIINGKKMIIK